MSTNEFGIEHGIEFSSVKTRSEEFYLNEQQVIHNFLNIEEIQNHGIDKNLINKTIEMENNTEDSYIEDILKEKVFEWPLIIEKEVQEEKRRLQKQKRLEEKRAKVENAKNPDNYETYESSLAKFDSNIQTFCARKKGKSHVVSETPCQDYCLKADSNHCCILTIADGVGSCQFSDVASKLACTIMIKCLKELEGVCKSEEDFIEHINDISFKENFVNDWKSAVIEDWKLRNNSDDSIKILQKEILKCYGTTFMFAVITKRWITIGNIGDGQILLFNNSDWEKIRFHSKKLGSKTAALSNQKGYIENFKIKSTKREYYVGLLMSTDGIYDVLSSGSSFYNYAKETADRFDSKKVPYLPFCIKNEAGFMEDISQTYTQDDCSVIMALDSGYYNSYPECFIYKLLNDFEYDGARLFCRNDKISIYNAMMGNECRLVAFVNEKRDKLMYNTLELETADVCEYEELLMDTEINGQIFQIVKRNVSMENLINLDGRFDIGYLMEKSEQKQNGGSSSDYQTNTSIEVLKLFCKIKLIEHELKLKNLCFNNLAPYLIFVNEKGDLNIDSLALCSYDKTGQEYKDKIDYLAPYFENMIGILRFENVFRPVFSVGYLSKGQVVKRLDQDEHGRYSNMFYLAYNFGKRAYYLCNCSKCLWHVIDKDESLVISENEKLQLKDGLKFVIGDNFEEKSYYEYYSLERFAQNIDLLRGVLL